ncbi:MAG: V-type ATPase subunit [Caldicoprobacterales bacterium]|jgi:V/A-type H+-transporting ATPase subunit C
MPEKLYVYAVARIRSKEMQLLDTQFINQLMAAPGYRECLKLLMEKGWGKEGCTELEQILTYEQQKTWAFISELVEDMSVFNVLLLPNDYHNLKAAIKTVYTGLEDENLFLSRGTVNAKTILEAVKAQDYSLLPEHMRTSAREAYRVLTQTGDGQLCDLIIDKAALEALYAAGKEQTDDVLRLFTEQKIASSNIKIAVRAQRTGKPLEWMQRALAACDSLDIERLSRAAASGLEDIYEYLKHTEYWEGVNELEQSLSLFERWCDDRLIQRIQPQKYNPFSIGPLAAYLLARDNEIRTVRIILLGKLNQLSNQSIRERLRIMYV